MPQAVSVAYTRNTVRVTFRAFTWEDLQASADTVRVSLFKVEGRELVAIPSIQNVVIDGVTLKEVQAGEYHFFLHTQTLTPGEYRVVFDGAISGSGFYEPVPVTLKTMKSELGGR